MTTVTNGVMMRNNSLKALEEGRLKKARTSKSNGKNNRTWAGFFSDMSEICTDFTLAMTGNSSTDREAESSFRDNFKRR